MHRECPCHVVLLQIGQSSLRLKTNDRDTVLWNSTIFSSKVNFLFFFFCELTAVTDHSFRVCIWKGEKFVGFSFFQRISRPLMLGTCLFKIFIYSRAQIFNASRPLHLKLIGVMIFSYRLCIWIKYRQMFLGTVA